MLLFCVTIVAGDRSEPSGKIQPPSSHILLITIDTWRWDYLGVSGSGKVKTPHLDTLARNGLYFSHGVTPVPLTTPSHASIFTGLLPFRHGIRINGQAELAQSFDTLAELLSRDGYTTAAFVSSFTVVKEFGLDQGFQTYRDELPSGENTGNRYMRQVRGDVTLGRFIEWYRTHGSKPNWFVWIHFYDPHAPYAAPDTPSGLPVAESYGKEVAWVDQLVGQIQQILGNDPSLTWCILGDHGEGLEDHGERRHGLFVYDETIRIPWILSGKGVPEGQRVDDLIQTVDLLPTLLDLKGMAIPAGLDGRSLFPYLKGESLAERPAYLESYLGRLEYGISPIRAIRTDQWKWIDAPRPELYNLTSDPGEKQNLLDPKAEMKRSVPPVLRAYLASLPLEEPELSTVPLDREAQKALQSLGYLGGKGQLGAEAKNITMDPKDLLPWILKLEDARDAYEKGEYNRSIQFFKEFLEFFPDAVFMNNELGMVYLNSGHVREAARLFAKVLTLNPEDVDARLNLGGCLVYMGRFKEAREQFEAVLQKFPDDPDALVNLGSICYEMAPDPECMKRAWGHFLEIVPDDPESDTIRTLVQKGKVKEKKADKLQEKTLQTP
ncbi:MAG TPA: sulfatase-like hydrolase/transferase [Thermoanaerobaculia bacterium]|nr:sulfatase-like hydrolase/transferase [Thermoanaerobaculia bacterium]